MSGSEEDIWLFKSHAGQAEVDAVTDVIQRGTWWAKGEEISEFESKMAAVADREYGIAFNSGTSALYAMLRALDVEGGEVVVPSFTFPATANAVVAAGATPVFADIETESFALDPADVESKVTADTEAIMPIHFAGDVACRIRELRDLADAHDAHLLEDACHSPGATLDGEPAGSFGTAGAFSFCFNKVITTGEGGMVVTDSDSLARDLRLFRSHGCTDSGEYITYGLNLRMPTICAAIGVAQVEKLDAIVETRRQMASELSDQLGDLDSISLPSFPPERKSVYQLFNLLVEDEATRNELAAFLDELGIPSRVTYDPVHLTTYYRSQWGWSAGDLPVTERISGRILTLPFHLDLSERNLERISNAVCEFSQR